MSKFKRINSRGASVVELTLVLLIIFMVVLATWSIGIIIIRYSTMADVVSETLRTAAVLPGDSHFGTMPGSNAGCDEWLGNISRHVAKTLDGKPAVNDVKKVSLQATISKADGCTLIIHISWPTPFDRWIIPMPGPLGLTAQTNFEDADFLGCPTKGCSQCTEGQSFTCGPAYNAPDSTSCI